MATENTNDHPDPGAAAPAARAQPVDRAPRSAAEARVAAASEARPEPLRLACTACRALLDASADRLDCPQCGASLPVIEGVPHFVSGDGYWGEIPAAAMESLLAAMRSRHWREALEVQTGTVLQDKAEFIADERRANWIYDLPLDRSSRVLDVGCGMGSIAAALSPRVGEVWAVESVRLRVDFCAARFAQDRLDNVRVVRADALDLPFPPESFDAVVLNGVLEWLGKGQGPDTRGVQLGALRALRRLLRSDGYLVVAIENRIGIAALRGGIDHSYLRYTSLMPRWLADRVTRARRGHPYDTYTYSHRGYLRLLGEAGFDQVRTLLPIWGYNRPDYLLPLDRHIVGDMLQRLAASRQRSARYPRLRRLERRLRLSRTLAADFLFLARTGPEHRRSWIRRYLEARWASWGLAGDPAGLEFEVLNRSVTLLIVFAAGVPRPQVVVKLAPARGAGAFSPPVGEATALRRLAGLLPAGLRSRVPRALELAREAEHDVAVISHLGGRAATIAPGDPGSHRVLASVERLAEDGLAWLRRFGDCADGERSVLGRDEVTACIQGSGRYLGQGGDEIERAIGELLGRRWPAAGAEVARVPQHGDYALTNILDLDGGIGVVDWERLGRVELPGFDALHLANGLLLVAASDKRGWRPEAAAQALLVPGELGDAVRRPLAAFLSALGLDPDHLPVLYACYLMAYAREYGPDPSRRGMVRLVARQLTTALRIGSGSA